jgi:uncharacterized circularly permuted ATP-grasp superfamily protein/uncharacterized alpha-E superfamily protein
MAGIEPLIANNLHFDETRRVDGSPLPDWQSVLAHIVGLTPEQRARRQQEIVRQLRANGLAYQPEDGEQHREHRALDLIPLLYDTAAWQQLCNGLQQRVRLQQALYRDIYGEQRLLKDNILPAAMLYAHRGYLRDLVNPDFHGEAEASLAMAACDVGRDSTGAWRVLDDHCQYPAGVGYALENRIVLSRVLPRSFKQYRVSRVASYFRQLHRNLLTGAGKAGHCVILSYASSHPHYFEFAWLAKYLGYPLVEPADLSVRDNTVYLKTITGLQPVDVILRLIDDTELDPLVIGSANNHGVPGLVEAARRGGVRVLNPMGTGVLENPAFNSIMSQLCQALLNEPLQLPSQQTWWLGDSEQREAAMGRLDELQVRHIDAPGDVCTPAQMSEPERLQLLQSIELTPASFVAQQPCVLSAAPSLLGNELRERPFALRLLQVAAESDFYTMPGGLCLLDAERADQRHTLQDIPGSKDVWVLSDQPVQEDTLLRSRSDDVAYGMANGELPSRIAESEFWRGRHSERVESAVRLLRRVLQNLLDEDRAAAEVLATPAMQGLLRALTAATGTYPGFAGRGGKKKLAHPDRELTSLLQDTRRAGTLANALQQWQLSASSVGDRLSSEQLRVLNRLNDLQAGLASLALPKDLCEDAVALGQTLELLDELLLVMSANTGLEHENVTHGDVWMFTMLGRRIERAHQISVTVSAVMSVHRENPRLLEYLLRLFDSVMTYRARYQSGLDNRLVLQLLLLDEINPRSLAYQFKCIQELIADLPGRRVVSNGDPLNRLAVAGLSRVRLADPEQLLNTDKDVRQSLQKFLRVLQDLSASMTNAITAQYFTHTETRQQIGPANVVSVDSIRAEDMADSR